MSLLQDKAIFISGAGSGIGRATALLAAEQGARLSLGDQNPASLKATAREIETGIKPRSPVLIHAFDVREEAGWQSAINATLETFGQLDGLVNCAGTAPRTSIRDMPLDAFQDVLAVNLEGSFLGLKYGHQAMKQNARGGAIINMSSILGQRALPEYAAYSAAKGGCRLMTKAAAIEFGMAGSNIRVNSVHPGAINTNMLSDEAAELSRASIPMARTGNPGEVANTIVFLLSDGAAFMTGSEVTIDGGWNCRIHQTSAGVQPL